MVKTSRATAAASQPRPTRPSTAMSRTTRKPNKRSSHHHSIAATEDTDDVGISNAQSVSLASDMSADECDMTPTKPANKQRSSVVHGFALKKSPNEYVCNIYSKV